MRDHPPACGRPVRLFAWTVVGCTFVFLLNTYLTHGRGWPGAAATLTGTGDGWSFALLQALLYAAALAAAVVLVRPGDGCELRADAARLSAVAAFVTRAAFWAVLLVGLADYAVSFLRAEEFLPALVGDGLTRDLGRPDYRGTRLHVPLIAAAVVIAAFTRGPGFTWLTLLVVAAELQIVISRFVFSYEQAFMADLVRFWYGALFLFASAHTLMEEGHVRVDVIYAGLSTRTRGMVNAIGAVLFGMSLCTVILTLGMWDKTNVIVSPLLAFEITQSGFGMYVKYLMAGFLAVFATSMMVQFAAMLLDGYADWKEVPGGRTGPASGEGPAERAPAR
ncbi:MAG: TRAP transporter small permease subunit [Geminicoccaceae bacterium]|nr:TRAP transporter small permease subunit [Geminicoccaceae bacterium]